MLKKQIFIEKNPWPVQTLTLSPRVEEKNGSSHGMIRAQQKRKGKRNRTYHAMTASLSSSHRCRYHWRPSVITCFFLTPAMLTETVVVAGKKQGFTEGLRTQVRGPPG